MLRKALRVVGMNEPLPLAFGRGVFAVAEQFAETAILEHALFLLHVVDVQHDRRGAQKLARKFGVG